MSKLNELTTLPQLLRNVVENVHSPEHPFLSFRGKDGYENISYKQALDYADALSAYFLHLGINKGDRLGLIIENCPEYVFYDQALQQIGAINVSIYPTLSESEILFIMNDAGIKTLLVGNQFLLRKILKVADKCPSLLSIITNFDDYQKIASTYTGTKTVQSLIETLQQGSNQLPNFAKQIDELRLAVLPDDIASLIYTSGTTGTPKGAMLTHHNFVMNVKTCLTQLPFIDENEVFLSFLPLSHVFERTATYHVCIAVGCRIAFAQSLELLGKNMMEVRPTIMACVPRLLEKINEKAVKNATAGGGIKAKIFNWALEVGKEARVCNEQGKPMGLALGLKYKIADKLVFSKIKEKTGGNLKFMISGGAALPKSVGEFFGNLGIKILEGFGLTETSPVMSVTEFNRQIIGTVGRIIPGIEVGIQNYDTKEIITLQTYDSFKPEFECAEGEIIVRGHCVMQGYWNNQNETRMVIDDSGWFHTGDVGRFYKGNLQITDRIKNIIVNSYGKNVYPTQIENAYLRSPRIEQIFLIGDKRDYITAIIIPSRENMQEAFGFKDSYFDMPDTFIEDENIIRWINEDVRKISQTLSKFERIKNFAVKRNPFSIDEEEMTPTMKTKRRIIEKKYADKIEELYLVAEMEE